VDLSKDGILVKLSKDYYMHVDYYNKALKIIKEQIDEKGELGMPEFRTLLETSRKYAILIMDYTDQKRITELHGLVRVKGANYGKI
jgi:selenocysteine-specific elongation factor